MRSCSTTVANTHTHPHQTQKHTHQRQTLKHMHTRMPSLRPSSTDSAKAVGVAAANASAEVKALSSATTWKDTDHANDDRRRSKGETTPARGAARDAGDAAAPAQAAEAEAALLVPESSAAVVRVMLTLKFTTWSVSTPTVAATVAKRAVLSALEIEALSVAIESEMATATWSAGVGSTDG